MNTRPFGSTVLTTWTLRPRQVGENVDATPGRLSDMAQPRFG